MTPDVDLAALVPADLPDGREVVQEGLALGKTIERGISMYCEQKGVRSEREYREQARQQGIACTGMNVGLATWADTREALGCIYEDALSRGVRPPDRFNLLLERRMGLPKEMRATAPSETGPMIWTEQDWWELGHTVPMQPEASDNTLGSPGAVDNTVDFLRAGITYMGTLTQYTWRWPYWNDETAQLTALLKSMGICAAHKHDGVVVDSYLDDGYPAVFHDYANYVGWAMLERHVTERLVGAAYSISWAGLTRDPLVKAAITLALEAVNPDRVPQAFIHGDTISNGPDLDANFATLATDTLFLKLTDRKYKLGTAVLAVPVTEAVRIPSWQEISAAQAVSRNLEGYLDLVGPMIDWNPVEKLRDILVAGGRRFLDSLMSTLAASGIDTEDPGRLLMVVKLLGPERLEQLFGAGEPDESYPRGRRPVLQTDLVRHTMETRDRLLADVAARSAEASLCGRRILVASTDVHEFAELLLSSTLKAAGGDVIDFGVNRDPEDIVKVVVETDADAIVLTTHNGVARSFATTLLGELRAAGVRDRPVFMGGVLNEDVDGGAIPVDVRGDLNRLGVQTPASIEALVDAIAAAETPRGAPA
jgi:methylmalonyl-CoA mutase cobalamin-binding domain/chain